MYLYIARVAGHSSLSLFAKRGNLRHVTVTFHFSMSYIHWNHLSSLLTEKRYGSTDEKSLQFCKQM